MSVSKVILVSTLLLPMAGMAHAQVYVDGKDVTAQVIQDAKNNGNVSGSTPTGAPPSSSAPAPTGSTR